MASSQKGLFLWADQIPPASWTDPCNRSSQQAAEAVGAVWDGKSFKVPLIGVQFRFIRHPDFVLKISYGQQ